jgi:hypothetical protein
MPETNSLYRYVRPETPLAAWVERQPGKKIIVHKKDLAVLLAAGHTNVAALSHGGPQPGEAWIEAQS